MIRVRGATISHAFAEVALAVAARAVGAGSIEEREVREVRAHGQTRTALLANWINECLYVLDVEGFVWRRVEFAVFESAPGSGSEPLRVHSFLHGQTVEPDRLVGGVGAVPAEAVSIRDVPEGHEIELAV